MAKDSGLSKFLNANLIDSETWEKANIDWALLQAIAADHEAQSVHLENSAELFAKEIQKFNGVHSVRWRVKDSEHLMKKIVRKRAEGNQKYIDISPENYFEIVSDLVGLRALHLFKENCFEINTSINSVWNPIEKTVAYIRDGDSEELKDRLLSEGFEVKKHPAGYRSVHYVIESTPLKRKVITEIQVRTIFEEGWSEIDHKVRYPNFLDNPLVGYFLEIFNRMAGSADDMGGFVLGLVGTLGHLEKEILIAKKEKEEIFLDMEQALSQLESVKKQDQASKESVAKLKAEVARLKEVSQGGSLGIIGSTAAEQASRGLMGSHVMDIFNASAAEQASRGLLNSSYKDLLKANTAQRDLLTSSFKDMLGSSAAEQASRGLLGSSLKSILGTSAAEQAASGLTGIKKIP